MFANRFLAYLRDQYGLGLMGHISSRASGVGHVGRRNVKTLLEHPDLTAEEKQYMFLRCDLPANAFAFLVMPPVSHIFRIKNVACCASRLS